MPRGLACAVGPPRLSVGFAYLCGEGSQPALGVLENPGKETLALGSGGRAVLANARWPGTAAWPRLLRPAAGLVPGGAALLPDGADAPCENRSSRSGSGYGVQFTTSF